MRGCFDGHAFVDEFGDRKTEEEIENIIDDIGIPYNNACYAFVLSKLIVPVEELRAYRVTQKVFCGRYGHQPITVWENRPVTDLNTFCRELKELVEAEAPDTRERENR